MVLGLGWVRLGYNLQYQRQMLPRFFAIIATAAHSVMNHALAHLPCRTHLAIRIRLPYLSPFTLKIKQNVRV